jgi:cytoskeletal protein RodZ
MALSMDEQRMLAEIERRLAAEDPGLASRLSTFRRPGPASAFRSPRARIIGSLFTVALVAVISLMVYAMVPFRAHVARSGSSPSATPALVSGSTKTGSATAGTHASRTTTTSGKTSTTKTTTKASASTKTGSRTAKPAGNASAIGNSSGVTVRSTSSGSAHAP